MAKVKVIGCGGSNAKATLDIETDDFGIEVNGKFYRFDIDNTGNLTICLINGVDAKITTSHGYAAVKLYKQN